MNPRAAITGRAPRRLLCALMLAAALLAAVLLLLRTGSGATVAAAAQGEGEPTAQTDDSLPAGDVTMIGSSPAEEPNETWGIGHLNSREWAIVHYDGSSWSLGEPMQTATGQPLSGFEPTGIPGPAGEATYALSGRITEHGAGVIAGTVPDGEASSGVRQILLVRAPGGAFKEAEAVPDSGAGALIDPTTESLYSRSARRAPLIAALDEPGGAGGALVVPVINGTQGLENGVLHWTGSAWTREKIEIPQAAEEEGGFRVLAIAASSPTNAWLIAQLSSTSDAVALFHRQSGAGGETWAPVRPSPSASPGEALKMPLEVGHAALTVVGVGSSPTTKAQVLTITGEGVWIDGLRDDTHAAVTTFFKPEGEAGLQGQMTGSWCVPQQSVAGCTHALESPLPKGSFRSFAWPDPSNPSGFGQRVITGMAEGVSLRLEGEQFTRVLALGGSAAPDDVGGTRGAAFSSPREGWLGNESLPVHITLHPAPDRLQPYPVPFHAALTAVAPQPGAPVGARSSEALAVGDQGEVARYIPGQGWLPESLFETGGRIARTRLRSVAWPTPNRAFAVGEFGTGTFAPMWLWRGETGLWEPDPATPPNFRGNLLGIAFAPGNSSRGYAVGQQGVLLSYGKTWTQEPTCGEAGAPAAPHCIPGEAAGASFTSVAFAGQEAIVAYRQFHPQANGKAASYTGGLLVNSGGGWQVDQSAAAGLGEYIPWAVAGLPDGGAAVSATEHGYAGGGPLILERNAPGAAWTPTPAPYPNSETPGSLALFREGGQLRVIGSGGVPDTIPIEEVTQPPVGFPPALIAAYPIETGYVIRQTSDGWSDEEHDRNEVLQPPADYSRYDTVYQGDPTSAVLVDPTGAQGWAVGGTVDPNGAKGDTSDISRYPAEAVAPPGVSSSVVPVSSEEATFAIGGGAQCAAPCADRAQAGVGPDVWLSSALALAARTPGVRAFVYTGPRVSTGATDGPPSGQAALGIPYARELSRYAAILGSSALPAYGVTTPSELAGEEGECPFEQAFSGFPAPFGTALARPGLLGLPRIAEPCASGSSSYYALESSGPAGKVRVIVLDDGRGGDVHPAQLTWVKEELANAKRGGHPVMVVGNSNLGTQIAGGDGEARALALALIEGGASAYFFDSPEENVSLKLQVSGERLPPIPAFGSGTLGYVSQVSAEQQDFHGHSGFLLAGIKVSARNPSTNVAPVTARLTPDIGELALEAKDGALLQRSHAALFEGLARRPRAGGVASGSSTTNESDIYVPIPANCIGAACASALLPEYTFSSSNPAVGDFVEPNLQSGEASAVLLGANGQPIHDAQSGLFCALNAGTTVVTISAGGLSASLTVTVQPGSVRRPCGTTPINSPASQQTTLAAPVPASTPAGASPSPAPLPLPLPPAPPPAATPPAPAHAPAPSLPPVLPLPAAAVPLPVIVPPPLPPVAEPTPPGGTSAVTSSANAPEREEEDESATESVSNQAVAYRASEHEPVPMYLLGLILLAALAGAGAVKRTRRGRKELRIAPATISGMRAQRRISRSHRRPPW